MDWPTASILVGIGVVAAKTLRGIYEVGRHVRSIEAAQERLAELTAERNRTADERHERLERQLEKFESRLDELRKRR